MKQKNLILMVVAVGCGLAAAFLTTQMSAKTPEQVDVIVAAKDLTVGTTMTREDLKKMVKYKKMAKDALPPTFVSDPEQLVDKRLSRSVRAEELFNPADIIKGGVVAFVDDHDLQSIPMTASKSVAGFVGPGSRVDVLATLSIDNKLIAFPLLVNMQVMAVDNHIAYTKENIAFPQMTSVTFAMQRKQSLLVMLAQKRNATLELILRHPDKAKKVDEKYDIEAVMKLLQDEKASGVIVDTTGNVKEVASIPPPVEVKLPKPPEQPKVEMVKVLIAKNDIPANTTITPDLIKDFEEKLRPKEYAGDAIGDLTDAANKKLTLKTMLTKGQPITPAMLGEHSLKDSPRETYQVQKPAITEQPKVVINEPKEPKIEPKKKEVTKPVIKTFDVLQHTKSGTLIYRYQKLENGKEKLLAILKPEQAGTEDTKPEEPKATPDKKVD